MNVFFKALLTAPLVFLSSCSGPEAVDSSDINENKVFGIYSSKFDAGTGNVSHEVQFKYEEIGGSDIRLTKGAEVSVGGFKLNEKKGAGLVDSELYYSLSAAKTNSPDKEYKFTWLRNDKSNVENTVTMTSSIDVFGSQSVISTRDELEVKYSGESIAEDEIIYIQLRSDVNVGGNEVCCLTITLKPDSFSEGAIFSSSDLQKLPKGKIYISADRWKIQKPQNGHQKSGGQLISIYKSRQKSVELK